MSDLPDLDKIALMARDADNELQRLCDGKRFKMCIPARPDDSDLVIGRALNVIPALLRRVRELEAERERILPMLSDIHKALDEQHIKLNLLTLISGAEPVAPAVEAKEETDVG